MSTKLLITLLLSIILAISHLGSAQTTPECSGIGYKQKKTAAIDSITLSIHEVREVSKFASRIHGLKYVFLNPQYELIDCLERFISSSFGVEKFLDNLWHSKNFGAVASDAQSLKKIADDSLFLAKKCDQLFVNFDDLLAELFDLKLHGLETLIDDAVNRLSNLGRHVVPSSNNDKKSP